MGLFGKKEANHNGLLNKIANPNPNGPGLFGRIFGSSNNGGSGGGLLGGLFNRGNKDTTQPTSFQDPNNHNNGGSW